MKHASEVALKQLSALLIQIRALPGLKEKKPGVFYQKSQAYLHFHEDGNKLYADLKIKGEWMRYALNSEEEQSVFIGHLNQIC